MSFVLRATRPILGPIALREGELVVVRPGEDPPVAILRPALPNYGALLGALEDGGLEPLNRSCDEVAGRLAELRSA